MANNSITLEQKVKTNRLLSKFIGGNSATRDRIAEEALQEVNERDEALKMLVESGLNVKKAFGVLDEALTQEAKGPPSWGDKIRAAQVVLDLIQVFINQPSSGTAQVSSTTSLRLENLSDEELKFYINFGYPPSEGDLARLQAVRGQKALPGTHTSPETDKAPTSE